MDNAISFFEPFDFVRAQDTWDPLQRFERDGGMGKQQQTGFSSLQNSGNVDCLSSQYGFNGQNTPQKESLHKNQSHEYPEFGLMGDSEFDMVCSLQHSPQQSLNINTILNELSEVIETKENSRILNKRGFKRKFEEEVDMPPSETSDIMNYRRLTTEEVMRVAGAQYIESFQQVDTFSMLMQPFGSSVSVLTDEETRDVQLAHLLLASAEKVGNHQYERASHILSECEDLSFSNGSPVQRVVYFFAEALKERIFRETGRIPSKRFPVDAKEETLDVEAGMMSANAEVLACYESLPFSKLLQFPGVQTIIENVASAKRVHLIDFGIKIGVLMNVLIQALSERQDCTVELLKVTAVGTINRENLEDTGKRLISLAESMSLPFSFKIVMVSDMKDLKEELFEIEDDEEIAILAPFILRTMINRPDCLDSLMRVLRNLNPCIMVISEVEANHNSPSFFNRFIEALFFYGAFFDCLEAIMDRNDKNRKTIEKMYFGQGIMNMVATEGQERIFRHVGIEVWRTFFMRFGWAEAEFSHSSLYQASLLLKEYACGSSCTLDMNGKCLTVGWKGTPLTSLSAWKLN